MTERLAFKRDCLNKDKVTYLRVHLFVLVKAIYTYINTVTLKTEQPTHLLVICSMPSSLYHNNKTILARSQFFFITFCALSEAKGMVI